MSRFTVGRNAVLAAMVAFVVCVFLLEPSGESWAVELTITATVDAKVQLYYDVGHGIRDEDSITQPIIGGRTAALRFVLPPGEYRHFRFDPLDRPGRASISEFVLRSPSGHALQRVLLTGAAGNADVQVESVKKNSTRIVASGFDPIFEVPLAHPMRLVATRADWLAANAYRMVLFWAGAFALLGVAELSRPMGRKMAAWFQGWRTKRPRTALAAVALATAGVACHPLFFGNSLLSPNFHIALLYPDAPAVPGVKSTRVADAHGGDVGAMFWQHMPYAVMQHDAIAAGELPLWNRYGSCGITLLGQGQSMFSDPVHLLVIAADGAAWAFDAKFILLHALFCCGLGWTVWALRRDWTASAVTTVAAGFIGFFIFRINHPAIFSVCYAPWILWAWARYIDASDRRQTILAALWLFGANWMVATSGTVKEASMLAATLNLVGMAALVLGRNQRKFSKIAWLVPVGIAFALTTMPLWLTFVDALVRARTFSDQPTAWRLPARLLAGLCDDLFYRELDSSRRIVCPSANLLIVAGTLWCLVRPSQWRRDPMTLWLIAAMFTAIGIAFDWFPTAWLLAVPGLRNVGSLHNTFSCVAIVFMTVLAGCGFSSARDTLQLPFRRLAVSVGLLAVAAVVLLWYYVGQNPPLWRTSPTLAGWLDQAPEHTYFYLAVGMMFGALITLHALARRWLRDRTITWPTPLLAGVALIPLFAQHGLQLPLGFRNGYFLVPATRANLAATSPTLERLERETAQEPFRFASVGPVLMPDYSALHGLETFFGPDALMNHHFHDLIVASGVGTPTDWMYAVDPAKLASLRPMLDLLNVKFCVSPPHQVPADAGYLPVSSADLDLYESPTAWPRAFFTDRIIPYRGIPEIAALARAHAGHPFAAVLESELHSVPNFVRRGSNRDVGTSAAATGYRLTPNSTSFVVHASGPGVIVLQEAWLKGDFKVTIDGKPVTYFRTNHAFKGIAVKSSGDFHVSCTYWPRYFTLSLFASLAGFVLLAAILLVGLSGNESEGPPARFAFAAPARLESN